MSETTCAYQRFERTLAWHCAPSLAGIKAADLICWHPPADKSCQLFLHYTKVLASCGVCLRPLCPRGDRILILVFRPEQLAQCLSRPDVRHTLAKEGYPSSETTDVDLLLAHLCHRLAGREFPHEIGLFLGYPVADVEGFRIHGGRSCKLSGCWKVYGDAESAGQMFLRFHRCRQVLTQRISEGWHLEQLLAPAPHNQKERRPQASLRKYTNQL